MVPLFAEPDGSVEEWVVPKPVPAVAVSSQMMGVIVGLKLTVVSEYPKGLFRHVGLQYGGCHLAVIIGC